MDWVDEEERIGIARFSRLGNGTLETFRAEFDNGEFRLPTALLERRKQTALEEPVPPVGGIAI